MLESSISFSSLNCTSYYVRVCSQISKNSLNVVFTIKIPKNLQKMFAKNETLQNLITE